MNTDNLVTAEQLAGALKMAAEGMKKKPGLMKSAVPHMELIYKYVEQYRHGQGEGQMGDRPRHPAAPRDLRGDGLCEPLYRVLGRHCGRCENRVRPRGPQHLELDRHGAGGLFVLQEYGRPAGGRQVAPHGLLPLRHLLVRQRQGASTRWAGATASRISAWNGPTTRGRPRRWTSGRTSTSG